LAPALRYVIYLIGYLLCIFPGSKFVEWVLRQVRLEEDAKGITGAGRIIGILERTIILTLVIVNQIDAVAIIFAAKSIIRFQSSKERKFAEYYLIGTMSSVLFALMTGLLSRIIVKTYNP